MFNYTQLLVTQFIYLLTIRLQGGHNIFARMRDRLSGRGLAVEHERIQAFDQGEGGFQGRRRHPV